LTGNSTILALAFLCASAFAQASNCANLEQMLEEPDSSRALTSGYALFQKLEKKYPANAELRLLKSRIAAAEYIATQIQSELQQRKGRVLKKMAGQLFGEETDKPNEKLTPLTSAKDFYNASAAIFETPVPKDIFDSCEKTFLSQYYSLKIASLVDSTIEAAKALSITDRGFDGLYDYALVLPLLHASNDEDINIGLLPKSMRTVDGQGKLSESCLLHYGLPARSMEFAKQAANIAGTSFSEVEFYESATKIARDTKPDVAADCLSRAVELLPPDDADRIVALRLEAAQMWLDSDKYMLAAAEARKAFEAYPQNPSAGRAIWLHYFALSKADDLNSLLSTIDSAICDPRCVEYVVKLKYMKWYSLRCRRPTSPALTAIEKDLLENHADDPIVAPVMLFKAQDLMARQNYDQSRQLFAQIIEKFPTTRAAVEAKEKLSKLEARE
jgi:tetratricopeptide (TPR) repeat protein